MEKTRYLISVIILTFFVFFLLPSSAYAYVDPGTGSYVIQLVLAFIFGGLFVLKRYWKKIKSIFKKSEEKNKNNADEEK